MGMFGRLGTVVKSNLNDLISRSEDPEKMLNQMIIDMKEQLVEAKVPGVSQPIAKIGDDAGFEAVVRHMDAVKVDRAV